MKKKWSRKAALLLAAVTILTSLPTEYLYAAQTQETHDTVTPEEQSNEETVVDTALTGQESVTDTEQETTETVEGTTATEEIADGTEAAGEIETQSLDSQTAVAEDVQEAQDLLNYLVLDNAYIAVGGTQNVVVNIGEDTLTISGGRLLYHRVSDGAAYEMAATETDGNGLRFSETFADESRTGEYALDAIIYEKDGQEYQINLSDAGMDVRFGVNTEVETNPDAEVVDEANTDVDMDVVSFDENGNQTSEASIEDAIATQKAETAESGISTARYNGNVVVVLDPGHDGTHSGSSANGFVEAQLNLKIAQYCKAELEEYYGVTVYMTRDSASCPNGGGDNKSCLQRRADIARDMGANLFVSLHNNYSSASSASGAEIWYPNQNYNPWTSQVGGSAASCILEQLASLGLKDRGTQIRNAKEDKYPDGSAADYYAVIRHCKEYGIPGIIVEHAFMSNSSDAANFLSNDEGLKKLGVADATGIAQYFGLKKEKQEEYSAVFDAAYYANRYPDLKTAFGNDDSALLQHFIQYGMAEGRQGSPQFDVYSYKNLYPDLRAAFGNNLKSYYMHYISSGKAEGRKATGVNTLQKPVTTYNGIDYSAVYDYNYYLKKYSDLAKIYTNDDIGLLAHFVNCGMSEGRQAKDSFDVFSYRNQYQDLRLAFGKDLKSYYFHYMNSGKKEGRTAAGVKVLQNPVTIYNGTDYSAVYDYNYYNSKYSDLKSAFKGDDIDLLVHFVNNGMKEGRQASKKFNVQIYKNNYTDLQQAFGNDLKPYYMHYIQNGKAEGRIAESQIYHSVITKSTTTVNQMVNYYNAKASYPAYYGNANVPDIRSFCQIYYDEATAEGVDPALAFTQAMKETGFLKFTGQVKIEQFNFAGMGVTGAGTNGDSYQNVREGIRAHVQHLKAYAVKNPAFANQVVDKRYSPWFAANRSGTAPYIGWLGISENPSGFGRAAEKGYGYSILNDYMNQLYKY